MQNLKVILSGDGSSTIYNETLQETYHSTHGAITESKHVFLQNGFRYIFRPGEEFRILEVGLGTGLNALLTFQLANELGAAIHYSALEPFPISNEVLIALNYEEQLGDKSLKGLLNKIHELSWEEEVALSKKFILHKFHQKLQDFTSQDQFDLIYFDAFAPKKQPDLWEKEIFTKLVSLMRDGACLVSYCASGQFKRNLKEAGLLVESMPGPPGKKEMTRALKIK